MQRNLLQKRKARIIACLFLFAAVLCFAFRIVQMKSENLFLYEVERHKEDYLQIAKYWNKNRNILDEIFYDKEIIYMYEIPELLRKGK